MKITCEMFMDLAPLVKDGIAGEDSTHAVLEHTKECDACRELYDGKLPPQMDQRRLRKKIRLQLRTFFVVILLFGILAGIAQTGSSSVFYNALIMPAIGILGYVLFQVKSFFVIPVLVFAIQAAAMLTGITVDTDPADWSSCLSWSVIYTIFAWIGCVIAALFTLAIRKKGTGAAWLIRAAAFTVGLVLVGGICWFANGLVGNPVCRYLAGRTAQSHLEQNYPDSDYYVDNVQYNFKNGGYDARIRSAKSTDRYFTIYTDWIGAFLSDSYASVTNGMTTALRLEQEYRTLTDAVFTSPRFTYASDICFGELIVIEDEGDVNEETLKSNPEYAHALLQSRMKPDELYDIRSLGAQAGHLVIYLQDDTVTEKRAAEILIHIRRLFDQAGVPFCTIDFVLEPADQRKPGASDAEEIRLRGFLYEDINKTDLEKRIEESRKAARSYYQEIDQMKK